MNDFLVSLSRLRRKIAGFPQKFSVSFALLRTGKTEEGYEVMGLLERLIIFFDGISVLVYGLHDDTGFLTWIK